MDHVKQLSIPLNRDYDRKIMIMIINHELPLIFWYSSFGKPKVMLPCVIRSSVGHRQTISLSSSLPADVDTDIESFEAWTCMMHLSLYLLFTQVYTIPSYRRTYHNH